MKPIITLTFLPLASTVKAQKSYRVGYGEGQLEEKIKKY